MSAWAPTAFATHYQASLDGNGDQPASQFQIDENANLVVDNDPDATLDWMNVIQTFNNDEPTGQDDDSYKGGVKEDTQCPGETTGSIPNNKSDLLQFGTWEEEGDPGYLHMYWARVTDPSGTTLMDFEFNQSELDCENSPNKQRTPGDLLIEYSIVQGGARASMTLREWSGTAWGTARSITEPDTNGDIFASGTINSTPISQMDTLTQDQSARTFGEASIDLNLIFDDAKCTSFGSAMLKSRSSDAFTSQLKDFIAPIPLTLTNCAKVEITKQTLPDTGTTPTFGFSETWLTDDEVQTSTFSLYDDQTFTATNVLFGTGYTVTEGTLPTGWQFDSVDCSASTGVVPTSVVGATVTFSIDDADDVLRCTYTNKALADLTIVKQVTDDPGTDDFDFTTTGGLSPSTFTLAPTATGAAGEDTQPYTGIAAGTYSVAETVPAGWNLTSATCDNGDPVTAIELGAGDDVTCTFVNARERGAIEITKTRKHQAAEGGTDVHEGVTFSVTDANDVAIPLDPSATDENGKLCVPGLLYGTYTVTESVPTGYVSEDAEQDVVVNTEADCGTNVAAAADVSFVNIPLTNITVSVDSQVVGGTASTIVCVDAADLTVAPDAAPSGTGGDLTATWSDLLPTDPDATLVCTITVDP